jgi:ornithine decarboxylase
VDKAQKDIIGKVVNCKFDMPCLVFDRKAVQRNYLELKKALDKTRMHYALKANSCNDVLECLKEVDANFEIASLGELKKLESIGIDGKCIIFSNPLADEGIIRAAHKYGVRYFSFFTIDQLKRLLRFAPNSIYSLRLKISDILNDAIDSGLSLKEIELLVNSNPKISEEINGLCFHMSNPHKVFTILDRCEEIIKKYLKNIKLINIGGGFNLIGDQQNFYEQLESRLMAMSEKYSIKFYSEPGRGIVSNGIFLASVESAQELDKTYHVYLDIGSCIFFKKEKVIFVSKSNELTRECFFHGLACNNSVIFKMKNVKKLKQGDVVCFMGAGAYFQNTDFHSFKKPNIYFL